MSAVLHHALLGVSVAALVGAGLRGASLLAASGLPRTIVVGVLAAAAAVAEALVLGVVGLAGSPVALTLAAVATWGAARALLPRPDIAVGAELAAWWSQLRRPERVALWAIAGAAGAWAGWQLRNPAIGFDSVHFHLPEIVAWAQGGHTGSVENAVPGLPTGSYPITTEVMVAWGMAISRSFVPFALASWVTLALTGVAGWVGLRALGVPRLVSALAVGALCTNPWLLAWQSNGSLTDPPALAWLVACAALCTLARERPVLLAPAILAAGLSVGTKTTTLPLAAVVLVLGLHGARGGLRDLRGPLLAGIAGALAVGGVWYLRNLVDHGSPFWPLAAAPWGDRVPDAFAFVKTSFLERPRVTIDSLGHDYVHRFGGGLALLAGGVMAPLISPRRRVLAAAAATAVAFLIWTDAPATGISPNGISTIEETVFSTTRYLLPVVAAGALALALAANGQRRSWAAAAILLGALVLNLVQTFDLGFPVAPPPAVALGGAAVGGLLAVPVRVLPDLHRSPWVLPLGAVAAAALLAIPASGYVQRHGRVSQLFSSSAVRWLAAESRFRDGDDPVAISPAPIAALAGDDLDHRQEVIRRGAQCESIPARAVSHWLVIYGGTGGQAIPASVGRCLPRRRPAFTGRSLVIYRPEGRRRSSSRVTDTAASSTIVISAGARKRGRP